MADHFADRYWSTRFWTANYFQGGTQDPGAMQATLSGAGSVSASLTAATATVPRGDDAGFISFTGAARAAIYERQLKGLEKELKAAPRPAKRREKAKRIRKIVLSSPEPVFVAVSEQIAPLIDKFEAQEIDWTTLADAIQAQISAVRRKRRHRNIAIAMLMAA